MTREELEDKLCDLEISVDKECPDRVKSLTGLMQDESIKGIMELIDIYCYVLAVENSLFVLQYEEGEDTIVDLRKENEELKSTIVKWHNDINDQLTIISELKKRIEELENPIPCSHPKIVSVAHAYMCEECKKCLI